MPSGHVQTAILQESKLSVMYFCHLVSFSESLYYKVYLPNVFKDNLVSETYRPKLLWSFPKNSSGVWKYWTDAWLLCSTI